ncbi:MAG: prepilin-type N-terminal cleavage/methylation domain-containing protein, partial [Deltaproteobacteria bacterium]|nr:prepilin-type N-terminal cleavage/methylation domain-containing protein [Deltaproteobacteria bacterium]
MKRKGFTLLEIVIVLFLITLILGLSTVFFAGYLPSVKVNATGREIAGMIRQARSLARMNMESRTVAIDLDGRTYGIEGLAPKSFPPDTRIRVIDPFSSEIAQGK